jgi:hypothetical protein
VSELVLMKLLDFGLTAAQVGLERQAVLDAAQARLAAGDTPEQVVDYLVQMRDEARKAAEEAVKE